MEHEKTALLFLLSRHVWLDNKPLDGQVKYKRPDSGVEHRTGKKLVCQVDRKEIRLAGSVQPKTKKDVLHAWQ